MTTRKLDKSDLDQLTALQESYQTVTAQIASCTIDEVLLSEQLDEIQKEKRVQMQQFKDLQQQESNLISSLKEKYGNGEINLAEGIFISQQ
jgi:hypothetical protein